MKKEMRGKILFWTMVGALVLGGGLQVLVEQGRSSPTFSAARAAGETVVIDAGHGGEDGGAVTSTGVPESGINLSIALRLDGLLGLYGVQTKVLRTTDTSLHDSDAKTLREKKVSDLHNRVAMIEETENATLISIHQNKFQGSRYHGAQVFYANEELSLPFAVLTQNVLKETLDPSNARVPTQIPDSIYLMNHITCRAILVECGFLSNSAEAQKLQTPEYQEKIAVALAGSFIQFQGMDPPITEGELPNEG